MPDRQTKPATLPRADSDRIVRDQRKIDRLWSAAIRGQLPYDPNTDYCPPESIRVCRVRIGVDK